MRATLGVNLGVKNKNPLRTIVQKGFLRSEADSNRCRRFCRPLVKPLAHQTTCLTEVQRYVLFLNIQNFSQ